MHRTKAHISGRRSAKLIQSRYMANVHCYSPIHTTHYFLKYVLKFTGQEFRPVKVNVIKCTEPKLKTKRIRPAYRYRVDIWPALVTVPYIRPTTHHISYKYYLKFSPIQSGNSHFTGRFRKQTNNCLHKVQDFSLKIHNPIRRYLPSQSELI